MARRLSDNKLAIKGAGAIFFFFLKKRNFIKANYQTYKLQPLSLNKEDLNPKRHICGTKECFFRSGRVQKNLA